MDLIWTRTVGAGNDENRASRATPVNNGSYLPMGEEGDKKEVVAQVEDCLMSVEFEGKVSLETTSVYGSIIALPQIGRCMDWNFFVKLLVLRSGLMLILNYVLQVSAIILIGEASQVMDVLAGKMHLCDFGKNLETCPNDVGCVGPGGTRYTAPRLYSFDIWSVRVFFRDSLIGMFPDQKDDIMKNVDPGEYGMENYYGRLMAIFIFMLVEVRDLFKIWDLIILLHYIPSKAESWVYLEKEEDGAEPQPIGDRLRFKIAGMTFCWKATVWMTVIIPKLFLWYSVCWIGVRWLMETSGILDAILGAITMDFVLTFDELIFDSLGNSATKFMMDKIEDFDISHEFEGRPKNKCLRYIQLSVPRRLLATLILMITFISRYYWLNCEHGADGSWVSQPMHLPLSSYFSLQDFLTNWVPQEAEPYWTMPQERP
mmetsp:Transcript_78719/g.230954  ORF Transcript_78719/g.230954 Transcript_78719/m.230954 type:complete len:428 (-) Transcript_78719:135-1418(-)